MRGSHVWVFARTPAAELRVKDAIPAFDAKLVQEASRTTLADGIGDGTEFPTGGAVVDARMRRISVSQGIEATLEGVGFKVALRRHCFIVCVSDDYICGRDVCLFMDW